MGIGSYVDEQPDAAAGGGTDPFTVHDVDTVHRGAYMRGFELHDEVQPRARPDVGRGLEARLGGSTQLIDSTGGSPGSRTLNGLTAQRISWSSPRGSAGSGPLS